MTRRERMALGIALPVKPVESGDGVDVGDDAALAVRARDDADAFGTLYERYVDRIYAYLGHAPPARRRRPT